MRRIIATLFTLIFFIAITMVMFFNPQKVPVKVFGLEIEVQLFIVVLTSLAVGILFAYIVGIFEQLRIRMENRRLRKELGNLKEEVDSLRNMPLKDSYEDSNG